MSLSLFLRTIESAEFDGMVRQMVTELKRAGDVHNFEDDVHKALKQSAKDGKLSQMVQTPTDTQVAKRTKDVKKETEKRLGNLYHLDRKILKLSESSYWKDMVEDVVHDTWRELERGDNNDNDDDKDSSDYTRSSPKRAKMEERHNRTDYNDALARATAAAAALSASIPHSAPVEEPPVSAPWASADNNDQTAVYQPFLGSGQ